MKKLSKALAGLVIGAVAFTSLGACSSASDQARPDREAEAAAPDAIPTTPIKLSVPASANFDGVVLTHSPPSDCSTKETDDKKQMIITCKNVHENFMGEQVFVRVPDYHYRINVKNVSAVEGTIMKTRQRDWANIMVHQSTDPDVTYNTPYKDDNQQRSNPWAVGVDNWSYSDQLAIQITITYLEM